MHCQICGTSLPSRANACSHCGSRLLVNRTTLTSANQQASERSLEFSQMPGIHAGTGVLVQYPILPENSSTDEGEIPVASANNTNQQIHADSLEEYQENKMSASGEQENEENATERGNEENATERLVFFSDGIIAFAMTIAAITIKIPSDAAKLQTNAPSIFLNCLLYIIAFVMIAGSWSDHHSIFHHIKRNTIVLVASNFLYLASITVLPIGLFFVVSAASALSAFKGDPQALTTLNNEIGLGALLFLASQLLSSSVLLSMWLYASSHSRLLDRPLDRRFVKYVTLRLLSKPITFFIICGVVILSTLLQNLIIALVVIPLALLARWFFFHLYRVHNDTSAGSTDIGRIQIFSDAIIAIAITLSIAQIELPTLGQEKQAALETLSEHLPLLHAFLISVVIMGVYWLIHYHLFRFLQRHDALTIVLNFCFLLSIALMIIPVGLYANYWQDDSAALLFFCIWQVVTASILMLMWLHATRKGRLLKQEHPPEEVKLIGIVVVSNVLIFLLLALLGGIIIHYPIQPSIYIAVYLALISCIWFVAYLRTHGLSMRTAIFRNQA